MHFIHARKSEALNHHELIDWVRKEQKMGTSEDKMRTLLSRNTSWTPEEVDKAFNELAKESMTGEKAKPMKPISGKVVNTKPVGPVLGAKPKLPKGPIVGKPGSAAGLPKGPIVGKGL